MPEGSFWTRALRLLKSWKRDWTAGRAARGLVTRGQVRGSRHPLRMPARQRTPGRASAQEKPGRTRTAQRCGDGPAGVPQDVSPKQYGPGGWPGPYLFLPLHRRDTAGGPLKPSVGLRGVDAKFGRQTLGAATVDSVNPRLAHKRAQLSEFATNKQPARLHKIGVE